MPQNHSLSENGFLLQPLPRQLWELRSSNASTSMLMLRMLHCAGIFAHPEGPISATLQRLQDQLMPCFLSVQPQLHSKKAAQEPKQDQPGAGMKIVAGPLARLPAKCQVRRKSSSSAWV